MVDALNKLVHTTGRLPEKARQLLGNVQPPIFTDMDRAQRAREQAEAANKTNTNDPDAMKSELDAATAEAVMGGNEIDARGG